MSLLNLNSGRPRRYTLTENNRGVSVIAKVDIPRGTTIIEEEPLFVLEGAVLQPKIRDGKIVKKGPMWQIVVQHLRQQLFAEDKAIFDALAYSPASLTAADRDEVPLMSPGMERTLMRFSTNALELGVGSQDLGVFQTCSRLNHSCMPSAQFT